MLLLFLTTIVNEMRRTLCWNAPFTTPLECVKSQESLIKNVELGNLKSIHNTYLRIRSIDCHHYLTKANALSHSRDLGFLTPPWCTSLGPYPFWLLGLKNWLSFSYLAMYSTSQQLLQTKGDWDVNFLKEMMTIIIVNYSCVSKPC